MKKIALSIWETKNKYYEQMNEKTGERVKNKIFHSASLCLRRIHKLG